MKSIRWKYIVERNAFLPSLCTSTSLLSTPTVIQLHIVLLESKALQLRRRLRVPESRVPLAGSQRTKTQSYLTGERCIQSQHQFPAAVDEQQHRSCKASVPCGRPGRRPC